ncbi:hypothetical protein AR457_40745 [Streptomyces agglomeratus]|uniref:hypothetical protein n=1 Tax=Streptomyces agglomeratus TaxID=285458 RepID=UPI00085503B4|nr:hypothetical protein [Streptomyces agglomeratus]OEJ21768.1 hypothetical protein AR457_40745 [Streptomyces agglomeratus]
MTAEFPAIDRDKSPLLDADHDVVRIAAALRGSPHIRFVDPVEPGDETVWFRDADGLGYELSLTTVEPIPDDEPPSTVHALDAAIAAIGNHPEFVSAEPEQQGSCLNSLDTITALTRTGIAYTLKLTGAPRPGYGEEPASPAADIAYAADRLLTSDPSDSERATAELLNYMAATWDTQDLPLRQHAQAVARSLHTL